MPRVEQIVSGKGTRNAAPSGLGGAARLALGVADLRTVQRMSGSSSLPTLHLPTKLLLQL